jgi:hypothetical protein
MEALIEFSSSIPSRRLDSISSVSLNFRFDFSSVFEESTAANDFPKWERIWRIMGSMGGLKTLKARIVWGLKPMTGMQEKRFLEPIMVVQGVDDFQISLKPLRGGGEQNIKDAPFRIIERR